MNSQILHITLYDLAGLGVIFVGLAFSLQLGFIKSINRTANRFLALALLVIILGMVWLLGVDIGLATWFQHPDYMPFLFSMAVGPLVYFYIFKITWLKHKFGTKQLLHFCPLLLQLAILIPSLVKNLQLSHILQLLAFTSVTVYLYLSHRLIPRFQQHPNYITDRWRHGLWRLRRLLLNFGILWLLWVPFVSLGYFGHYQPLGLPVYYLVYLLLAAIIIAISAIAFSWPEVRFPAIDPPVPKPPSLGDLAQKGVWLKNAMKANLYYQDPELSLASLAGKLQVHPRELSRIINVALKKGFNDFISEYRVAEIVRKMQDPAYDRITLLGIAYDSGFNSKSTFHRIFKEMTGKSPAEYKVEQKKEVPTHTLGLNPRIAPVILNREAPPVWPHVKLICNFMFKNYLKIAWRNLVGNKAHSLINITGLSVGMAVAMLIGLWIWDELSFDKNFKNYDHIAQIKQNFTMNGDIGTGTSIPWPMGPELRKSFGSDFKYVSMASFNYGHILAYGDKKLNKDGSYFEPSALDMLSVKMVKGSHAGLSDPLSILLSASTAKAYFGDADPMDKTMKIDNNQVVKVAGIYEDMPDNSSFSDVNFIASWDQYAKMNGFAKQQDTWRCNCYLGLVQLADNADIKTVSAKIKDIKLSKVNKVELNQKPQVILDPMKNWHLYSDFKNGVNVGGRIQYVWMFGIIGFFVLLLACINFMNLSTARSEKRAKEVGIRKAIGSLRVQLIYQFLSESLLVVFFAFALALLFVQLGLPFFNDVAGKKLSVLWGSPLFWLLGIGFSLITGLISGSYPALYLSSFQPVRVLKGTFKVGRLAAIPRKVLVVLQFTVSITLIIGTIVVFRQIQFAKNRPVGYSREGLVTLPMVTGDIHKQFAAVKDELTKSGAVVSIAEAGSPTTGDYSSNSGFDWRGKDPAMAVEFPNIDISYDYAKTVGMQFVDGRDISSAFLTDSAAFIINQSAAKAMNFKNPVGETITWDGKPYKIIGLVKDMVSESPYYPVRPTLFHLLKGGGDYVIVRINPQMSTHEALGKIEKVYKAYNPAQPFDYQFVDEEYAKKFGNEERIGKLASFFASLAIFISCLGLFGMAQFMAEQRTKEIGVRKVLGASVFSLWGLLSKDFVGLVVISLFIATPTAWYFMHSWLQNYQYRSEITWRIFALTGAAALIITLLTVSYQSIRAALANPVRSLRSE